MENARTVIDLFNESLAQKIFNGVYTERCFVNKTLGYRDKIIIDLPNVVFSDMKDRLLPACTQNGIKHSCVVLKNKTIELFVEFPSKCLFEFGAAEWLILENDVKYGEINFCVTKHKHSETNHGQKQLQLIDIFLGCKEMFRMATLILVLFVNLVAIILEFLYKALKLIPSIADSMMPLFLAIVNGLTKIVGGFYLLILALRNGPQQPPQPFRDNRRFLALDKDHSQVRYRN